MVEGAYFSYERFLELMFFQNMSWYTYGFNHHLAYCHVDPEHHGHFELGRPHYRRSGCPKWRIFVWIVHVRILLLQVEYLECD